MENILKPAIKLVEGMKKHKKLTIFLLIVFVFICFYVNCEPFKMVIINIAASIWESIISILKIIGTFFVILFLGYFVFGGAVK